MDLVQRVKVEATKSLNGIIAFLLPLQEHPLHKKLFAIYVLNILEYMNKQQKPGKTALICCRDAQADLGLHCPHMQKEPFSHDMALS